MTGLTDWSKRAEGLQTPVPYSTGIHSGRREQIFFTVVHGLVGTGCGIWLLNRV